MTTLEIILSIALVIAIVIIIALELGRSSWKAACIAARIDRDKQTAALISTNHKLATLRASNTELLDQNNKLYAAQAVRMVQRG